MNKLEEGIAIGVARALREYFEPLSKLGLKASNGPIEQYEASRIKGLEARLKSQTMINDEVGKALDEVCAENAELLAQVARFQKKGNR